MLENRQNQNEDSLISTFTQNNSMTENDKPFDRMVSMLVSTYGMSREGAEKLVAQTSEAIYTIREEIRYRNLYEEYLPKSGHERARIEACKQVINSNPTWSVVAEEIYKYQLSGRITM